MEPQRLTPGDIMYLCLFWPVTQMRLFFWAAKHWNISFLICVVLGGAAAYVLPASIWFSIFIWCISALILFVYLWWHDESLIGPVNFSTYLLWGVFVGTLFKVLVHEFGYIVGSAGFFLLFYIGNMIEKRD